MDTWLRTCLLLCLYGFFKELRPSEPFLTEYLLQPPMNLTNDEVNYQVYPVWTYSYLSLLVVVFLLTDLLRYKPVIVFEGIAYIATWSLLLWARGVTAMQLMEFTYGIATSTEVAYYTYIYAKVAGKFYQRVTSFTRAALLAGRFLSGVLSQILTSSGLMDYHSLNYLSLFNVSVAFIIACFLPPVSTSVYFHRQQYIPTSEGESGLQLDVTHRKASAGAGHGLWMKFRRVLRLMWGDFKEAYTNKYLVKWSIWWAFATCGNFQVGNYIQPLWESVAPVGGEDHLYNGAVEATQTLLSALSAFGVGYLHLNWELLGEGTLAVISLLDGALLVTMGISYNIKVCYINYIIFRVSYQMLITIASYQVAKGLREDSYGLVFGINMFLSLLIQSILTLVVVQVLQVEPHTQFVIYGVYFMLLALVFFGLSSYTLGRMGCEGVQEAGIWEPPPHPPSQEPPLGTIEAV
ncbi:thiamine transporter 1-like [Eriocheir sinensis]|uniref:thiamine transporter 1-like n=1 Tax=Eriocheir sinensis TaxID=95602 RepID=UPI0021C5DD0D|nr:thiamine transporter 1-like [Eriocheir sinensis]XP_050735544.1 thiamine transporter 1-like [Eriocheir sinensis]XP_050735545.1 thiamine transporter 1-like [Eriocheir sinensis]